METSCPRTRFSQISPKTFVGFLVIASLFRLSGLITTYQGIRNRMVGQSGCGPLCILLTVFLYMRPGALLRQFGIHAKVRPIGLCDEKKRHFVIVYTSHTWY